MKEAQAKTIYLDDYKPTPWQAKTLHLTFELGEEFTVVTSRIHFQRDATDIDESLVLHGEELTLVSIAIDDQLLTADNYEQTDKNLCLTKLPIDFKLKTVVHIEPQNNTSLDGLYKSSGNFCSQCEAQCFRKITYYFDRPDVMSIYTTHIIADKQKYPVLLSNGNLIEQGDLEEGKHYAIWNDPHKKPSYLFALVAGTLEYVEDHYRTLSGRDVTLRIYTEAHNIDYCDHAMTSLKRAMVWDEQNFGLEYDLDIFMIVAVDDFNMGAMENKGLNVFNSRLVFASPEIATDRQFISIEAVIGHEYFHNWTGNRVTCRDWFQLILKEGLTVYRDSEFTADLHSRPVKRIEDARMLRNYQFAEDASPMAHPIRPASYMEINNFYTVTIYEKGAEVVRLYRTLLGVDGFRKGIDLYFKRHDGQAVTTEDFLAAMADANHTDLSQMQRWYDQAGTPVVNVSMDFDAAKQQCTLHFEQSAPEITGHTKSKPFLIPIKMGLLNKEGTAITLQRKHEQQAEGTDYTFQLTEQKQSLTFINIDEVEAPLPSLLRNFSAPVKLHYNYSEDDYSFLMSHDNDPFNRWQAGQTLAMETLLGLVTALEKAEPMGLTHGFIQAFQNILNDTKLDHALIAEALSLPSCSNVVDQLGENADPDTIYSAVTFMRETLAKALRLDFEHHYAQLDYKGAYEIDSTSMGRRALRNVCLSYLAEIKKDEGIHELCYQHFSQATNMTDTMAGLAILCGIDCEQRKKALAVFESKWFKNTQVMDNWFSIQAAHSKEKALDIVGGLMQHKLFSLNNPNKVRSVIGSFSGNFTHFHAKDGSGYAFMGDQVLALDAMNPQIASRMVRSLMKWRQYEPVRAALMKRQLKRISMQENLSLDVGEIVNKSLDD